MYREFLGTFWSDIRSLNDPAEGFRFAVEDLTFGEVSFRAYDRGPSYVERNAAKIRQEGSDFFQIHVLSGGSATLQTNDREVRVQPGELLMLDMGQPSHVFSDHSTADLIQLTRSMVSTLFDDVGTLHGRPHRNVFAQLLGDHLASVRRNMQTVDGLPQVTDITARVLAATLAPSRDNLAIADRPLGDLLQQRAARFIGNHLRDAGLSPDSIAAALGVSRRTLYRAFEASGGVMREIQSQRLDYAHSLLLQAGASRRIKTVAFMLHFGGESQFARSFKRKFGYSPSEVSDLARSGEPWRT